MSATAFVVDAHEVDERSWEILMVRADGIQAAPVNAGTEKTGWAALPELDKWLQLLGYARTGPWTPGAVPRDYKTTVDTAARE